MRLFELVALAGIVNIITRSEIFLKIREGLPTAHLRYLASCPQCTGVWVGMLYFFFFIYPHSTAPILPGLFLWAGIVSIVSSFLTITIDTIYFIKSYVLSQMAGPDLSSKNDDNVK